MSTLSRRRLLTGAGALAALFARRRDPPRPSPGAAAVHRLSLQARRRVGRPAAGRLRALDAAGPGSAGAAAAWGRIRSRSSWEVADRRPHAARRAAGSGVGVADLAHSVHVEVPGLEPGAPLLVPLPRGRRRSRRSAAPAPRRDPATRPRAAPLRLRVLPALGVRPLRGVSPHAGRRPRPRRPPGRLHLRDLGADSAGAPARPPRAHRPRRLSPPPRALQDRRAICRPRMPRIRGSSPGTTTRCPTTTPAITRSTVTIPRPSGGGALAAYQAYYEHMPLRALRPAPRSRDADLPAASAGERSPTSSCSTAGSIAPCRPAARGGAAAARSSTDCAARLDPAQTRLGRRAGALAARGPRPRSAARWNVLAQQQLMAQVRRRTPCGHRRLLDGWLGRLRGRAPARSSPMSATARVPNPVVIGGDVHSYWVTDLKVDFTETAPVVATEFVGTSISSPGTPVPTARSGCSPRTRTCASSTAGRGATCAAR